MNKSKLHLKTYLYLLFGIGILFFDTEVKAQPANEQDSLALVELFNATDGQNWDNNYGWLVPDIPINDWYGIELNDNNRVSTISLNHNNLTGNFPDILYQLSELRILYLDFNNLTGNLPANLPASLELFMLHHNNMYGCIPNSYHQLCNSHGFVNSIFTDNPELPSGGDLRPFCENSIGECSLFPINPSDSLVLVDLYNSTNGDNWLNHNNWLKEGRPVSSWYGVKVVDDRVYTLNLKNNNLVGSIPESIGDLSELFTLDFSENKIDGSIPKEIGNLLKLNGFYIFNNKLTGLIPKEVGNLKFVGLLSLFGNNLSGEIPAEIGNMAQLQMCWLGGNELSGQIPKSIGDLKYLRLFDLSNNQLTGEIPSELGNCKKLNALRLHRNQLSGSLPKELAFIPLLSRFDCRYNQLSGCFPIEYKVFCGNQFVQFLFNDDLPNMGLFELFCQDFSGACGNSILGEVLFDENENCQRETGEESLINNWKVKASNGTDEYYSLISENGFYSLSLPSGTYLLELISPNEDIWESICTEEVQVDESVHKVDLYAQKVRDCSLLLIDMSTPVLRRCFTNRYEVKYCNDGTIGAEGVTIEIELDLLMTIKTASLPYTQSENTYTFEIGEVKMNRCNMFNFETKISCEADLNQTLCAQAIIYPNNDCDDFSPDWSGASLKVSGECVGDEVKFQIENVGTADMKEPGSYIIIEDQVVLMARPESLRLKSGESKEMTYPANGATYILKTDQVMNHPGNSHPVVAIEGCGTNADGTYSKGFVTQYPEDDADDFVSIDCQEVTGSWDPNDKIGYPIGYGDEHLIDTGQIIDYRIRFQNTGTDTAFKVVVRDVISEHLDLSTLSMGVSSHPYTTELFGDTLRITFDPIELPDSNVNEVGSHGFIKFKIGQQPNLPIGTVIENTAGIYFDFNEAVVTNTTTHTIGKEYYKIVSVSEPLIDGLKVDIFPNPFSEQTVISIKGIDFGNAEMKLYNMNGVLLKTEQFVGDQLIINGTGLVSGIYYFRLQVDGKLAMNGKLIMQ